MRTVAISTTTIKQKLHVEKEAYRCVYASTKGRPLEEEEERFQVNDHLSFVVEGKESNLRVGSV